MREPKVTVVIGTYKRPDKIGQTIQSYINQTFKDIEVVVVDDNHPSDISIIEATKSEVLKFNDSRVIYIKNEFNIGVPFVYQKWIDLVKTPYFTISGDGDMVTPDAIELMYDFLERNEEASMVHGLSQTEKDGVTIKRDEPLSLNNSELFDPNTYLKFHLSYYKKQIVFSWLQNAGLYRTEFFRVKKIQVTENHYWDFIFHCEYILHSKHIGYINKVFSLRHYDIPLKPNDENVFIGNYERLHLLLEFIENHRLKLVAKNFNINRYRFFASLEILRLSLRKKMTVNYAMFNYSVAFYIITKVLLVYIIFVILYPVSILSSFIKAIYKFSK